MKGRRLLAAGTLAIFAAAGMGPAGAATPATAQGWWSALNGTIPGVSFPAPPDVPSDGLYVAQLGTAPAAVAAVRIVPPPTSGPLDLVLPLATGQPPVGSVLACRTTRSWIPVQNGSWQERPAMDCSHPIAGEVAGDTLTFRGVESLEAGGSLAVGLISSGTARFRLDRVDASALRVEPGPEAAVPTTTSATPGTTVDAPVSPAPPGSVTRTGLQTGPQLVPAIQAPAPVSPALAAAGESTAGELRTASVSLLGRLLALAGAAVMLVVVAGDARRRASRGGDRRIGAGRFVAERVGHPPAI